MNPIDFNSKFPDMKPIAKPPSLWMVNGIGTGMYGSRDHDPETYSYVSTMCFCFIFIPLFALRAYRVIPANPGWYFLGKVPLSGFAKGWNILLVLAIVWGIGWFGWHQHTSTPDYIAGAKIAEAEQLAAAGDVVKAANLYKEVARGTSSRTFAAREGLRQLIETKLETAPPQEAAQVLAIAVELKLEKMAEQALRLANQYAPQDPLGAVAVLDAVAPVIYGDQAKAANKQRRELLEKSLAKDPDNIELITKLALAYEAEGQREKGEPLLLPHQKKLGDGEGARILGQIFVKQGKTDEALALLTAYMDSRLEKFLIASQSFNDQVMQLEQTLIQQLKSGKAPNFDYQAYGRASKEEQARMVNNYLDQAIIRDENIKKTREEVMRGSAVVSAALDVGLLLLGRAQKAEDGAAKKKDLEQAEKTFLAIGNVAGKSAEYRLNLGQVYFWLGKHDEGPKLFDQLLVEKNRDFLSLLQVSLVYRQIGDPTKAKTLAEEAYDKAVTDQEKYSAAIQRAILNTDQDDRIAWLEKCNLGDPNIKADMHSARANKALSEGNDEEAIRQYNASIGIYETLPENSATINNNALNYLGLYVATGKRDTLDKCLAMLERAITLKPSDTILLRNVANTMLEIGYREAIGSAIELERLRLPASNRYLAYLYDDAKGQKELYQQVAKQAGFKKARANFEQLLVLSPKSADAYRNLTSIYSIQNDQKALDKLLIQAGKIKFGFSDRDQETLNYYLGKNDEKYRALLAPSLQRKLDKLKEARTLGGKTLAVAACELVIDKTLFSLLEGKDTADELVKLAEEAHQAAPSAGTRATLMSALLTRASLDICKKDAQYQALFVKCNRSLGATYLLAYGLNQQGDLPKTILAHADVQRTLKLIGESMKKFPDQPSEWMWAMLKAADPKRAEQVAETLRKYKLKQTMNTIEEKVSLTNPGLVLEAYWRGQINGNTAPAIALWKSTAARGIPLPEVPK